MSSGTVLFRIPLMFKLLMSLIIGVVCAFYKVLSAPGLLSVFFILIFLTFALLSKVTRNNLVNLGYSFALIISLFLMGVGLGNLSKSSESQFYFGNLVSNENSICQVRLLEPPVEKENSVKCLVEVQKVDTNVVFGESLIYLEKNQKSLNLNYGDVLLFNGSFKSIVSNGNPKEFDYARYLRIHNIYHQAYVRDQDWLMAGNDGGWFYTSVYDARSGLESVLESSRLSVSSLKVAKALILGDKESLDRGLLRTFSSAGAMHVLAVSGLHVGIIMLLFSFFLTPLKRLPKGKIVYVTVILGVIWSYALITGMSSSVLRAAVMFSFVIVGKELERDTSIYQSILVSAFVLIVIEPFVIFQVGFQLSYLAVLGIVFLQPKIYNLFYFKWMMVDKVWQITSVSLAAQIATFPLGLYYFHQFPNFFFISNLIVIPMAFAILMIGILYFVVVWIPYVEAFVAEVLNILIVLLNMGVKWIESLPYSIYWGVSIEWFEVFWMYLLLVLLSIAFAFKKKVILNAALFGVALLLLFNVVEQQSQNGQNQLVIYNVNKSNAIDVFYGRANLFLSDKELLEDEDKLLFHVKHNWYYKTGRESPCKSALINSGDVLRFGGQEMLLLSNDWLDAHSGSFYESDFYYLHDLDHLPNRFLDMLVDRKVIVGPNVKYNVVKKVRANILEENIHELRLDGAFELYF